VTLDALNAADRGAFVDAVGWVFEHSPWVAERAWPRRPFASVGQLHEAMTRVVAEASRDEQLALLRAHPDLGAQLGGGISEASAREQSDAGLATLSGGDLDLLRQLNESYRARFGFPFLLAVKGTTRQHILKSLRARLPRAADDELLEALRQVSRIAWFRLVDCIAEN
jgi:2-oxo-4-hydroxy-4-carboxy-5-ureidoimidazoline decarboxylase